MEVNKHLSESSSEKNVQQQQILQSEEMNIADRINSSKNNHTSSSNDFRSHLAGTLQIPYTGLVTRSLSPSLAERLGLDATTRGDVIVDIIPQSPAEQVGMRALNMSRTGSAEELIASRGDIILAVDGSSAFTTSYNNIDQFISENKRVGENITLHLLRDGELKDIEMRISSMPRFLWYENRNEGIKIKYPADWLVVEGQKINGEIVKFNSLEMLPGNIPLANVSLTRYLTGSSDNSKTSDLGISPDIEIFRILDINITSLDKLSGYSAVYYDYSQMEETQKILSVFVERDSQLYSFNFGSDPSRYYDYLPLAREMIESFQFLDEA